MVLNCFQNSAEPIKVYKVLVGAFVGNVGKNVGRFLTTNNFACERKPSEFTSMFE
jgi:hypothetical protein